MSESHTFLRLHKDVQRWIWMQNWTEFRDIQEYSIEPILRADCDLIISAPTAAGKTEAAFLPACSRVAELKPKGVGLLYISPLKALINDQYRRLQGLCEMLDLPLTPWHGDVLRSVKDKQKKMPHGIILITPESLEALLLHQPAWCIQAFADLSHIIIDEFHAFLGTERGCQLQSLMHRIEFMIGRIIPRIALSATLSNMEEVTKYLRPAPKGFPCEIIESTTSRSDLKIQLRGYVQQACVDEKIPSAFDMIAGDLFTILRGKSHLLFANSRQRTEELAVALSDLCLQASVPNEFFPHHGNLSKDIRESLESRLQHETLPTSAVCTMTLELGIDIGRVDSIAQITAPHSVASLRQRLGRSGRRGEAAVLRLFIAEDALTAHSHLSDRLRLETIQSLAMVNLLLQKWCEPAPNNRYHLSTLVQQTLSVIGQYGGVRANQVWSLLCETGPFHLVNQKLYAQVLRALNAHDLITQTQDGQLVLGSNGERLVGNYMFYTAFTTPEEYRLEYNGRILGTIPITKPLVVKQLIIFAGKRWEVLDINADEKVVVLKQASGGRPPKFEGDSQMVHDCVRKEMLRIYRQKDIPLYINAIAMAHFEEGLACFSALELDTVKAIQLGTTVHVLPWLGDQITSTIAMLLHNAGLQANSFGGIIDIQHCTIEQFFATVKTIVDGCLPTPEELAHSVANTIIEKHDVYLPKSICDIDYGTRFFDVASAFAWLKNIHIS